MSLHRLFPLIVVAALIGAVAAACAAEAKRFKRRPVPVVQTVALLPVPPVLPESLFIPNWILTYEPIMREVGPSLPEMNVYREDELSPLDAECVKCRPTDSQMMILAMALSAVAALLLQWVVRMARSR